MSNLEIAVYSTEELAHRLIQHYRTDTMFTFDYSFSSVAYSLRAWLEVVDVISAEGYDPRRVMRYFQFPNIASLWDYLVFHWYSPNVREMKNTIDMALAIWQRGYLLERAA